MSKTEPPAAAASELATRFTVGIVMAAVALALIYYGGWPFRLLVAAAAAVMMIEWGDIHRVERRWSFIAAGLLVAALLALSLWRYPIADADPAELDPGLLDPAWLALAVLAAAAAIVGFLSRRPGMAWGFLYLAVPSFALILLHWLWWELVIWAMAVTWATDIFAYFAGRAIGGPKLAPRISPKKTWAGLAGGVIGAASFGALVSYSLDLGTVFFVAGAPMAVVAQAGDLYESWLKRRGGVKDSGAILPGHGGVFDRLDGLLPVVVATVLLVMMRLWTA